MTNAFDHASRLIDALVHATGEDGTPWGVLDEGALLLIADAMEEYSNQRLEETEPLVSYRDFIL